VPGLEDVVALADAMKTTDLLIEISLILQKQSLPHGKILVSRPLNVK